MYPTLQFLLTTTMHYFTLFRIFGIYPVHDNRNFTILWTGYSIFIGVAFILISIRAVEEERSKVMTNEITGLVGNFQDLSMVLTECVWIFAAIVHKKILCTITKILTTVDLKLSLFEFERNYRSYWAKLYTTEVTVLILLVIFRSAVYVYINPYSGIWLSVATFLVDLLVIMGTVQFCNYCIVLRIRFRTINKQLIQLRYVGNKEVMVKELKILSHCHSLLSESFENLSKAFGLQMLMFVTNVFIRTLLTLFLDVKLILGITYYPSETLAVLTIWTGIVLVDLMIVLHCCKSAKNEGTFAGHLVHRLISRKECDCEIDGGDLAIMFSLQLIHRSLEFKCCGMFPLDYTVIYGVRTNY